jgi:hypothetical protein
MKNDHMLPPIITDMVEKLNSPITMKNEKMNYVVRLEVIRDYVTKELNKFNKNNDRK